VIEALGITGEALKLKKKPRNPQSAIKNLHGIYLNKQSLRKKEHGIERIRLANSSK
jgi:hypothetical protein